MKYHPLVEELLAFDGLWERESVFFIYPYSRVVLTN